MSDIRIYDPYYCKGGIVKSLSSCGFDESKIFNEDKDCYVVQKKKEVPLNDMIVTNPPYSGDHIRRAIHYAVSSGRPWAMLLPSYIFLRPWYAQEGTDGNGHILFLCPHERYAFEAEEAGGTRGDAKHVPFVTMWYIGGLSEAQRERVRAGWREGSGSGPRGLCLASDPEQLPRRVRKLLPFTANKAAGSKKRKARGGKAKVQEKVPASTTGGSLEKRKKIRGI